MAQFGKTMVIANPAARSGAGLAAARELACALEGANGVQGVELRLTERPGHAAELACGAAGFDTIVTLGGDGSVNEVMNGLMKLPRDKRPTFALVPFGSGNDYARSLGMPVGVSAALAALQNAVFVHADLGCCNGRYFAETLSFGLDAGIALDTVRRRARTGASGLRLYAASSASQLMRNKRPYVFEMRVDGAAPRTGEMLIFAVQVGRTYGSGFAICPDARIDDGLLDICIGHAPISTPAAAFLFLRAKRGKHTSARPIELLQARTVKLRFEGAQPPAQIDGEELIADSFSISVVPDAVTVLSAPLR